MAFHTKNPNVKPEPVLVDIDHESDPVQLLFSDDTEMDLPKGIKCVPDNHVPDHLPMDADAATDNRVQVRMLVQRPPVVDSITGKEKALPNMWLPRYCSKEYVLATIKRIELGC